MCRRHTVDGDDGRRQLLIHRRSGQPVAAARPVRPPAVTVEADDAARTVTLTTEAPTPFMLLNTGTAVLIVCDAGLADRSTLASGTNGTGPFVLDEAVANDHYTFSARDDYAWGPDGPTSELPGFPSEVVVRIIENESTEANLLLSGEVNIATIAGADRQRVESEGYFVAEQRSIAGEFFFNQMEGLPTADVAVRQALMGALDLQELMSVQTAGNGELASGLAELLPEGLSGRHRWSVPHGRRRRRSGRAIARRGRLGDGLRRRAREGRCAADDPGLLRHLDRELGAVHGAGHGAVAGARRRRAVARRRRSPVQHDRLRDAGVGRLPRGPQPRRPERGGAVRIRRRSRPTGPTSPPSPTPSTRPLVAEASALTGEEACEVWNAAEAELYAQMDILPFAATTAPFFGNGAEFALGRIGIIATSLRLVGGLAHHQRITGIEDGRRLSTSHGRHPARSTWRSRHPWPAFIAPSAGETGRQPVPARSRSRS